MFSDNKIKEYYNRLPLKGNDGSYIICEVFICMIPTLIRHCSKSGTHCDINIITETFPELYDIIYNKEIKDIKKTDDMYTFTIEHNNIKLIFAMKDIYYDRFVKKRNNEIDITKIKDIKINEDNSKYYRKIENKHTNKNDIWLENTINTIKYGGSWFWVDEGLYFEVVPYKYKNGTIKTIKIDNVHKFKCINKAFSKDMIKKCLLTDNVKKYILKKYKLKKNEYYV